jgi:hypothetical protein
MSPPPDALTEIAVGHNLACGIKQADSSIVCWGSGGTDCDAAGQLQAPSGQSVAISSWSLFACAIDVAGQVQCWGGNVPDGLDCDRLEYGETPPPAGTYTQLTTGIYHSPAASSGAIHRRRTLPVVRVRSAAVPRP